MVDVDCPIEPAASGEIDRDLRSSADALGAVISTPKARAVLGSLIAATAHDPVLDAELRRRLVDPRRNQLRGRIARAKHAGQIPAGTDEDWLADSITAPIWLRALVTRDPIDTAFTDHLVEEALRAVGAEAVGT